MQMDEGLDTGAMLLSESMAIVPEDTTALLHDRLATLGGRLICEALGRAERAEGIALPQPSEGISYANKIVKTEAAIDWHLPAEQIERRVRAFDPFPGAQFEWQGETVKVWRAAVVPGAGLAPGTVEAVSPESFTVACGQDALKVIMLQRPGGKRQPAAALLRAFPDLLDARLASSLPRKDR
jgi:methionyl-tRNA formyltransferase